MAQFPWQATMAASNALIVLKWIQCHLHNIWCYLSKRYRLRCHWHLVPFREIGQAWAAHKDRDSKIICWMLRGLVVLMLLLQIILIEDKKFCSSKETNLLKFCFIWWRGKNFWIESENLPFSKNLWIFSFFDGILWRNWCKLNHEWVTIK